MASACSSQVAALCASVEARPAEGGFEVVRAGHRRGPLFADREAAILHGEGLAPGVLVMNATGKVERCMAGHLRVAIAEARVR